VGQFLRSEDSLALGYLCLEIVEEVVKKFVFGVFVTLSEEEL
jgi:hypothetical protein